MQLGEALEPVAALALGLFFECLCAAEGSADEAVACAHVFGPGGEVEFEAFEYRFSVIVNRAAFIVADHAPGVVE